MIQKLLDFLHALFEVKKPAPPAAPVRSGDPALTANKLSEIALYAPPARFDAFVQPLEETLARYQINTPLRMAHFIAQIMHESGEGRYMEEIASGEAYEGRADLGNTQPGDGKRFKGRGWIQLTGRANYTAYQESMLGPDFVAQPQIVSQLPWAVDVAGWYWRLRKINVKADKDDLIAVTKAVNGGLNGFEERQKYLKRAKLALEVV